MLIVQGSRLYGKVDEVPGEFHVATEFVHANFITLWPTATWLVFRETKAGWYGQRIPLSLKSVAMGYLRCACGLVAFALGLFSMVFASSWFQGDAGKMVESLSDVSFAGWAAAGSIAIFCLLIVFGSRWIVGIGKATAHRTEQLARLAGLSDEVVNQIVCRAPGERAGHGFAVLSSSESENSPSSNGTDSPAPTWRDGCG